MAAKFTVVERGNPSDPTKPKKFYAQIVGDGEISLKDLAKRAAQISTVSYTDTLAVITALMEVMPEEIANGRLIRLGDLGTLYLSNKSDGAETAEKVNSSLIKSVKVDFRPGADFRKLAKTLDFQKAK